jgi:oxygen-independent coproporphyrinogen-3 oxidase
MPVLRFQLARGQGALPFDAYVDALMRDLDFDLPLVWGRVVHGVLRRRHEPVPAEAIDRFLQAASARLRLRPAPRSRWKPTRARPSTAVSTAIAPPA